MTDDKKPREFWIESNVRNACLAEVLDFSKDEFIHVIEYSAYQVLETEKEKYRLDYEHLMLIKLDYFKQIQALEEKLKKYEEANRVLGDEILCPENIKSSLKRYVENKIECGSFLNAVLENNLTEAIGRADHINMKLIPHIVAYCYNRIPGASWGSPEKVNAWLNSESNTDI